MQEKQAFCGTEEISAKLDISGALLLSQGQDSEGKWPWACVNACCAFLGLEKRQSGDMTVVLDMTKASDLSTSFSSL